VFDLTPVSIGAGTTAANYIGKSLYSGDKLFKGKIRDFRVYNRAPAPGEVVEISGNTGISAASSPALKIDAIIDDAGSRITLPVREGTDLTALAPQFTLTQGASISPASGAPRDFTNPVTYEVTGADGTKRAWTVSALVMRSPVLPGFTADPNIVRFGDTYYIYPTTDGFANWSGTQFKAYSSKDLVHWTDHGIILDLGPDISWANGRAWAPTMTAKNGKYYFCYSADTNIGVAVSDSPTGPFTDPLGKRDREPVRALGAQLVGARHHGHADHVVPRQRHHDPPGHRQRLRHLGDARAHPGLDLRGHRQRQRRRAEHRHHPRQLRHPEPLVDLRRHGHRPPAHADRRPSGQRQRERRRDHLRPGGAVGQLR